MVAGIPAKVIGFIDDQDPSLTMNHGMPFWLFYATNRIQKGDKQEIEGSFSSSFTHQTPDTQMLQGNSLSRQLMALRKADKLVSSVKYFSLIWS